MKRPRQTPRKPARTAGGGASRSNAVLVAPGSSAMFKASVPGAVVKVKSGPATIFVIQGGRVRATIEWPRAKGGTVLVPLKAVAATRGRMFVGVMPGLIPKTRSDSLAKLMCPRCLSPDPRRYPCCP